MHFLDNYLDDLCVILKQGASPELEQSANFQFRIKVKSRLIEGMLIPHDLVVKTVSNMDVALTDELTPEQIDRLAESFADAAENVYNISEKHGLDFAEMIVGFY